MVMSCALWSVAFDKERRRAMDFIVALWARLSMIACFAKAPLGSSVTAGLRIRGLAKV